MRGLRRCFGNVPWWFFSVCLFVCFSVNGKRSRCVGSVHVAPFTLQEVSFRSSSPMTSKLVETQEQACLSRCIIDKNALKRSTCKFCFILFRRRRFSFFLFPQSCHTTEMGKKRKKNRRKNGYKTERGLRVLPSGRVKPLVPGRPNG